MSGFKKISAACLLAALPVALAAHGEGAEGSIMGPVDFLWPTYRTWSAANDNTPPCGSAATATNRTQFPLEQGSVALTIAQEAWNVEFHIAFGNNPTSQSDFQEQVVSNISEVEPGHECYKLDALPSNVTAGTNATIQLEYWAEYDSDRNQTFYACADITFVETSAFTAQVPCFNVTASDFESPSSSSTSSATPSASSVSSKSSLSGGDKAGIAVGSIVGGLAILGAGLFWFLRKRRQSKPAPVNMTLEKEEAGSTLSRAETAGH
ncbi:uncharacterized protein J3D65DRAFT_632760 [Phyllosticta citribraziliensis]|uniref:Copper acquisition factor BIM1-like domain-containing protein n=1 Tax=Phyllosticta citribraziliensis TaxID=989973 RepID=A0ABR1LG65_9PEZI